MFGHVKNEYREQSSGGWSLILPTSRLDSYLRGIPGESGSNYIFERPLLYLRYQRLGTWPSPCFPLAALPLRNKKKECVAFLAESEAAAQMALCVIYQHVHKFVHGNMFLRPLNRTLKATYQAADSGDFSP